MKIIDNIFGCFISIGFDPNRGEGESMNLAERFRPYIGGERGISNILKQLKHEDYGIDLKLALFQFYVKPGPIELQNLKEIEPYRKKEKAIGIPVIVTDENFFSQSEEGRHSFLIHSILQKLDLLADVVSKKKLDTKMDLLKADLQRILMEQ